MGNEQTTVEPVACPKLLTQQSRRGVLRWLPPLRRSEWLLAGFFLYIGVLVQWRGAGYAQRSVFALLIPAVLAALAWADSSSDGRFWSIVRDWIPALLILIAYWSADWAAAPRGGPALEYVLIGWDRTLLNDWGFRAAIEHFGPLIPGTLELAYLLIYAAPPLAIAYFYIRRERRRLDDFLFPFLLGTLMTYSLLPHFPSEGPRFVFAGQDLPGVETVFRRFNLWILDRCDIRTSVFPSGHVTVAFSAAFAMLLALPERRRVGWTLLGLAVLVLLSTVYGRYHYFADGLAGVVMSLAAMSFVLAQKAHASERRN